MHIRHLLVVVLLGLLVNRVWGGDWPCFRGPNHDGTLEEKLTLVGGEPAVLWKAKVGKGHCSVAVAGGRLFTAAAREAETLICLDAANGQKIWSVSLFTGVAQATPSVAGGKVYALLQHTRGPLALCVSAEDGKELWRRELPSSTGTFYYGLAGSPRVWEELVFFNTAGGAAVRKDTGELAWAHPGHSGYATPVVFTHGGRAAVAFFTGDRLIAREARTGQELWTIPWQTKLHVSASDPLFIGQQVLLCSAYGRGRSLYDVSGASPKVIWDDTTDGSAHSFASGFARGDGVFFCTGEGLASLDLKTGKLLWQAPGSGSLLLIGQTLIRLSSRGELTAGTFDPSSRFQPTLRAKVLEGTTYNVPAYSDGKLYIRNEAGEIVCLKIGQ